VNLRIVTNFGLQKWAAARHTHVSSFEAQKRNLLLCKFHQQIMWKQLIAPTLIVAGLWFIVSPVTTYFIYWLDDSHQHALTRNLVSMHAANEIRECIWRVLSYSSLGNEQSVREENQPNLAEMQTRIQQSLTKLRTVATTSKEIPLVDRLSSQCTDFLSQATSSESNPSRGASFRRFRQLQSKAKGIAATTNEIREMNQLLWTSVEQHRQHWKGIVLTTRFVLVIVGPGIGIALGWWISQRVHRSISQINIILKDATVDWEQRLGELRVSGREDLSVLKERVEKVVERLRQVSLELAAARGETLRSERLAAVGQLAAGVAHELRNPLTSVKLLLQNAAQQPGDTKLNDDETCVVIDEIMRMESTIQGLLDFSRPPSPQRQRHDLRNTLQRALNLVQGRAKQQSVQIKTDLPDEPLLVDGDPEQIHQVCVNLLINGIEAHPRGVLEIDADKDPSKQVAKIRVRDFGPGIPPEILVHLFEPFISTKERGTGLGLAVSRRIVMQHDGSLTAENDANGGAIFTLELPLAVADRNRPQVPSRRITAATAGA
jgi:two-component system, NtrC family, sensor histidine kinase HydH